MKRRYQIIGKEDKEKLSDFLVGHGQFLLPMVELIERSRVAANNLIEVLGRASIEAVLRLSAQGAARPKHQGRKGNGISWHGSQGGKVVLSERRLDGLELLIMYIDGVRFGEHHVIVVVGVDRDGNKHVVGIREGGTENATAESGELIDKRKVVMFNLTRH